MGPLGRAAARDSDLGSGAPLRRTAAEPGAARSSAAVGRPPNSAGADRARGLVPGIDSTGRRARRPVVAVLVVAVAHRRGPGAAARRQRADAPTPTRVSIGVPAALGSDPEDARRLAAWWLSTYTTRMGPLYPRMLSERFGMAAAVSEIVDAARRDSGEELPPAAEELADEVTLMGTHDQAGDLIASWLAAGADALQLVLPPGRPEEELSEILEAVAAAGSPLTRTMAPDRPARDVGRRSLVASG
jgi:hypothetical protein